MTREEIESNPEMWPKIHTQVWLKLPEAIRSIYMFKYEEVIKEMLEEPPV